MLCSCWSQPVASLGTGHLDCGVYENDAAMRLPVLRMHKPIIY